MEEVVEAEVSHMENFLKIDPMVLKGKSQIRLTWNDHKNKYIIELLHFLTLSVFWILKMSILSKRSVAMAAHMRPVKLQFFYFFKILFYKKLF